MILAVFNPKGGVGKTTTAVNLATSLAESGRQVLLVDLEADMNASISLGIRPNDVHPSIADLLLHEHRPACDGASAGVPLVSYKRSTAASAYHELARELLKRLQRRGKRAR